MPFEAAKVYYDGSHYIAIPYVPNPKKPKRKKQEELIEVIEENGEIIKAEVPEKPPDEVEIDPSEFRELISDEQLTKYDREKEKDVAEKATPPEVKQKRKITKKELFEELYKRTNDQKRNQRKKFIVKEMRPFFKSEESTESYVNLQFERKLRNLISRRVRLVRKVNLQEFNYFCTFTYDGAKHTEETFRYKLKHTISNFAKRKGWKYVGVWERSPEKHRLHFHGLFYIPTGNMVGELQEVNDYSPIKDKVQHTVQNTYFNERFGRSDFKKIYDRKDLGEAMAYLMKYIEKSGEKIVYSKGLPQYFVSDIIDDDVICRVGQEDKKLLLYDDFNCIDEGCWVGEVSRDVIAEMPKSN